MTRAVGLSPAWLQANFTDNDGIPLAGGKIWTFVTHYGETVPTYADAAGTIRNPNPIILDSAGRLPVQMYLLGGQLYRFVLEDQYGNYITEINDVAAPMLRAGENITLDPPTGMGPVVTINAQGPGNIHDYGQGPTYMWASTGNGPGITLDGSNYGNFTTLMKVPVNATSPEVTITGNQIHCSTPGSYSITFNVRLQTAPIEGGVDPWPPNITAFGLRFSANGFFDTTTHTRYSDYQYDGIANQYQQETFSDTFTFSVSKEGFTKQFWVYAVNQNADLPYLLCDIEIICTRFGEPYNGDWPIPGI